MVKNLPAMWETRVQSLGWKDPLEEVISTHSSILSWRIPKTEESGGQWSTGPQRVGHNQANNTFRFHKFLLMYDFIHYTILLSTITLW